jgi:PRTRC genetic system protein B
MRFSIAVGSELELKLYQAVLLYRNDHGNRVMATVHGVAQADTGGAPALGAGQLLSTAALRELTKQLGTSMQAEYLPDNVVARTPEFIAWWTPASVRPMFFRQGSEMADVSGKLFPHPALLLAVCNSVLFVRAFPENKRPVAATKLAAAPYWNTDNEGKVCAGTMRIPNSVSVASIPMWQQRSFKANSHIPAGRAA